MEKFIPNSEPGRSIGDLPPIVSEYIHTIAWYGDGDPDRCLDMTIQLGFDPQDPFVAVINFIDFNHQRDMPGLEHPILKDKDDKDVPPWLVGIELLAEALIEGQAGEGDVELYVESFSKSDENDVTMKLFGVGEESLMVLRFDRKIMSDFVNEVLYKYNLDAQSKLFEARFDDEITAILDNPPENNDQG